MADTSTSLIYIMGRGHSGSTVLDAILGNARDIESIGELVSGIDRFDALCSCGVSFRQCEFWHRVRVDFEETSDFKWEGAAKQLKKQAHVRNFVSTLLRRKTSSNAKNLRRVNEQLVDSIARAANVGCVVDSSKEVTRGLFLMRHVPGAKIIHLIRNPERIVASYLHRIRKGEGFKFLRRVHRCENGTLLLVMLISLSWVVGNLLAEVVRLVDPTRVIRLRYEDLCENPTQQLQRLSCFLGYDLALLGEAIEDNRSMTIGHNIGGNRMRLAGVFVFDPHAGSKRSVSGLHRMVSRIIAWPLMLSYGYGLW